jgi:putative addiction module killer protein
MCDMNSVAEFIRTSDFQEWIDGLKDKKGRTAILGRLERFEATGNAGDTKPVGGGVSEMRIHSGPGYRIYYAVFGQTVILLGGDKSTQPRTSKPLSDTRKSGKKGRGNETQGSRVQTLRYC